MARALLALALVAGIVGCSDEVDPTVGLDVPFSLYGYLDPTADQQAIRVVPIADLIDSDPDVIDATMTSTDLESGETTAWRDSLITFSDGSRGHVFVADYTPRPGTTIEIEATRSDGVASIVQVPIPAVTQPTVGSPMFVDGGIGYPVRIEGAPRILQGTFRIVVGGYPGDPPGATRRIVIPFRTRPTESEPGVWTVDVPFVSATRSALESLGVLEAGLGLIALEYDFFVTESGWAPPSMDPDVLAEPGTFSNVDAGLGFVGAGYAASVRWIPSLNATVAAGFGVVDDPASLLVINEVMPGANGWVEFYNPGVGAVSLRGYSLTYSPDLPQFQPLPPTASVPSQGFYTVDLNFDGMTGLMVYGPTGELTLETSSLPLRLDVPGGVSYGSYPDGYSLFVIQSLAPRVEAMYDVFRGALRPTRNQPNELGLEVAYINEIYTEGTDGWVETVTVLPGLDSLTVIHEGNPPGALRPAASSSVPSGVAALGVAAEQEPGLVLPQTGGAVIVLALYEDPRVLSSPFPLYPILDPAVQLRAVDYRRFGFQTPGLSVGYLPSAPGGVWSQGLRPTRGIHNASARR